MSYLEIPRLVFSGRFQAAPSTVNNDPTHFDNANFKPDFQKPQAPGAPNGWWNPGGDSAWRLVGCKVVAAWVTYGSRADASDPIHDCRVVDSDRTVPAKIVDLDPEQQLVSEVWGLRMGLSSADGASLVQGRFEAAAFSNIWDRAAGGGGDIGASAIYQSVLTDLEWGDVSGSKFLASLREAARDGLLSVKFSVDGYNMNPRDPEFTTGRIIGSIGGAKASEPRHLVLGRHLLAAGSPPTFNFFKPAGGVNFCTALVDDTAARILLDLGDSLATAAPGGDLVDIGPLTLAYLGDPDDEQKRSPVPVCVVEYRQAGWLQDTGGIAVLPTDRSLTAAELAAVLSHPLVITSSDADGATRTLVTEPLTGSYVRADRFVYRQSPGETATVRLYASTWGKPYANARVITFLDPSQLQGPDPVVGEPASAVAFASVLMTDQHGAADLSIEVSNPGNQRRYIDGQVYGIRPALEENLDYGSGYNSNPWDFISLLVWDSFDAGESPTWFRDVQPIFQQYANLYPAMSPIVDLSDYDSVCANVRILVLALGLPIDDPNAMPVTRDLSDAKRAAILHWLRTPGPDGKPLRGEPIGPRQGATRAAQASTVVDELPSRGGKAAAAARRLMHRRR